MRCLYYHAQCFDGAVSAAMALDLLHARLGWNDAALVPVDYDVRSVWESVPTAEEFAVVDFLFHPRAALWVDHHASPFVAPEMAADFANGSRDSRLYDPTAPSCARVLVAALADVAPQEARLSEIVSWADKIDSAAYETVEEALFDRAPALDLSRSLAEADAEFSNRVVRRIRSEGLGACRDPEVRRRAEAWLGRQQSGYRYFLPRARLVDDIVIFDVDAREHTISRYFPFAIHREARYCAGILRLSTGMKITAMRNPWLDFKSAPLGTIMGRWGGGGHERIGSAILPEAAVARASNILELVVAAIREADRGIGECTSGSTSMTSTST